MGKVVTVEDRVREALDLIRPAIQMDGGDIELLSVEGSRVTVRLSGTCEECPCRRSRCDKASSDSSANAFPR